MVFVEREGSLFGPQLGVGEPGVAAGRRYGTLRYLRHIRGEHMGIEREFQSYGAQLVNRAWAVSAVTADPREVVVSL